MKKAFNLLFVVIIFISGIIAYSNSFDCSFHFDDERVLESSVAAYSSSIKEIIHNPPNRPIGLITFAINHNIHGYDVFGYHFLNLVIHLINAFLIWWITLITFSTPVMKDHPISKNKTVIAFLTGLLFITHPLATQSVSYISQRFTSMATLFYLLSLLLFIKGRLWHGKKYVTYILLTFSLLSALCGILTKEIVFTLPFSLILYDSCFIKASPLKIEYKDKILLISFVILAIFIIFFFKEYSFKIFNTVQPDSGYSHSISIKEYFFTQFSVILTYIKLFVQPFNLNLDYDYPVSSGFFELRTFLSFFGLMGILFVGVLMFRKYRLISFGIFWFFLTLSVESSIIPISQDVIYEHRTYLPGFGFFLVLTGMFFYFFRKNHLRIAIIMLLIIAALNIILTFQRNTIWKDDYTLWGDCIKKSPNKARVNHNFGVALFSIKGNTSEAVHYFNKAISLNKEYAEPYSSRGFIFQMLGKYENALSDYNEAIRLKPYKAEFYNNRGIVYRFIGQCKRALDDFDQAISLKSDYAEPFNNRGLCHYHLDQPTLAIDDYNKAISLKPRYADYYSNRGNAYIKTGKYQLAITDFNYAISIDPDYADAYLNRAIAHFNNGRITLGCLDAKKACDLGNCKIWEASVRQGKCIQ